jgi:hypothetical protein
MWFRSAAYPWMKRAQTSLPQLIEPGEGSGESSDGNWDACEMRGLAGNQFVPLPEEAANSKRSSAKCE